MKYLAYIILVVLVLGAAWLFGPKLYENYMFCLAHAYDPISEIPAACIRRY